MATLSQKHNRFWIVLTVFSMLLAFTLWFFVFQLALTPASFPAGSFVGRTDVSNLNKSAAVHRVAQELTSGDTEARVVMKHDGKQWVWNGREFEVLKGAQKYVEQTHRVARQSSRDARLEQLKEVKGMGIVEPLPLRQVLAGLDNKIDELCAEIERHPTEAKVEFLPNGSAFPFAVTAPTSGLKVNRLLLEKQIDSQFNESNQIELTVPVLEVGASESLEEVKNRLQLRAQFVTEFDNPSSGRGQNISLALSKVNGTVLQPGDAFSFQKKVGSFGEENGFQKAKIILNGEFIDAYGGGACQASTTVFNAALLAGLNIVESHCHSLQVGYVRQGFDAMVSATSDLKFCNNQPFPVYISAFTKGSEAIVQVFGRPLESGTKVERRNEVLKIIPHTGDKIVPDTNGEYASHVVYVGEFYRLKHPKDGFETNSWVDTWKDGKLVSSLLLRKNVYAPQHGILVEGVEEMPAYLTLPKKKA